MARNNQQLTKADQANQQQLAAKQAQAQQLRQVEYHEAEARASAQVRDSDKTISLQLVSRSKPWKVE